MSRQISENTEEEQFFVERCLIIILSCLPKWRHQIASGDSFLQYRILRHILYLHFTDVMTGCAKHNRLVVLQSVKHNRLGVLAVPSTTDLGYCRVSSTTDLGYWLCQAQPTWGTAECQAQPTWGTADSIF